MTLIPSTRPCSLDCTSLSELICNFLSSALSHFVLSTSCYIMRILLLCPLDCTSLSLICVSHTFLGSNCCLLWSVPSFHKFQFVTDLFSTFTVPSLFQDLLCFTKVVLTVHWTIPPSVSFTCALICPHLFIGLYLLCSASITCTSICP